MTRSELIQHLTKNQKHLTVVDLTKILDVIFNTLAESLEHNCRIELRGFGTFSLHHRPARSARNPKTGEKIYVPEKKMVHFKPSKKVAERLNK